MHRTSPIPTLAFACMLAAPVAAVASESLRVAVLDRAGTPVTEAVDGNLLRLVARASRAATRPIDVEFMLEGVGAPVARCTIERARRECGASVRALGWHWSQDARPMPERRIVANSEDASGSTRLRVTSRPVVLVHGFLSSAQTWREYTRDGGFLASIGVHGFAVGDGRLEGVLRTGNVKRPTDPTNTLAGNAAELARYIAGVRRRTGAESVDIVAHSMGGLISRYYIARLMKDNDVAQLVMLGSPHGGSECSGLPSALGLYMPAVVELRPAYLRQVFNPAVAQRHGVPFTTLAGNAIVEAFKAPCTDVPSDMVVAQQSAGAISGTLETMPVLHTDMTRSEEVFARFVRPLLTRAPGGFSAAVDASPPATGISDAAQFTQVAAGRVPPGGTAEVVVHLDDVAIASFALFDPSRSLNVTIRGASGNEITLTPNEHGLIRVDDESTLVHLGYGFNRPRPGPWRVTLHAPPGVAADYALSARVVGGAKLRARASEPVTAVGRPVTLAATLESPSQPYSDVLIEAIVRAPNGRVDRVPLVAGATEHRATWRPAQRGLHGVDVVARARSGETPVERVAFLAVEVR